MAEAFTPTLIPVLPVLKALAAPGVLLLRPPVHTDRVVAAATGPARNLQPPMDLYEASRPKFVSKPASCSRHQKQEEPHRNVGKQSDANHKQIGPQGWALSNMYINTVST